MHTFTRTSSRFAGLAKVVALTAALAGAAGSAQAGQGVFWSVNVNAPIQGAGHVGTTFSNTPRGLYGHGPVVIAPPVVYAPAPRVVYAPQPVYVQRVPEYRRCAPPWARGWHHRHDHDQRYGWRDEGRYQDRYEGRQEWREGRGRDHRDGDRYAWGDND